MLKLAGGTETGEINVYRDNGGDQDNLATNS